MKFREDAELTAFFDFIRIKEASDPRLSVVFHVANERRVSPQAGRRLKKKGVKPGVPDVFVPIPSRNYHGMFIEFKIKPNKLTDIQINFGQQLVRHGYLVCVAYSSTEAIKILEDYLLFNRV